MKILVTGGTGFLGEALVEELLGRGHEVMVLSRRAASSLGKVPFQVIQWPLLDQASEGRLRECEGVIHLAGEPIFGERWTPARKARIRSSRVDFTRELGEALAKSPTLKVFLSGSAVGFYGNRRDEWLTEKSEAGQGFLAEVCRDWEAAAQGSFQGNERVRVVLLRSGVVLGKTGGFLKTLEPVFRLWVGGSVGSGDQYMSWIHRKDWVRAAVFLLESDSARGPINLVAPQAITNREFSRQYARVFSQPWQIPVPAWAVRLLLGEMGALALEGQRVAPEALKKLGFGFSFSQLKEALEDIYRG